MKLIEVMPSQLCVQLEVELEQLKARLGILPVVFAGIVTCPRRVRGVQGAPLVIRAPPR